MRVLEKHSKLGPAGLAKKRLQGGVTNFMHFVEVHHLTLGSAVVKTTSRRKTREKPHFNGLVPRTGNHS